MVALIPTLGTLVLLLPRAPGRADPSSILSLPPMTYIGDISYSLYLWHWPVLVLGRYIVGGTWLIWQLCAAFTLMIALSHISKYHIEDRFRHVDDAPRLGQRTLVLSIALLAGTVLVAMLLINPLQRTSAQETEIDRGDFPGAYALAYDAATFPVRDFKPAASFAIGIIPNYMQIIVKFHSRAIFRSHALMGNPKRP